MTFEFDQVPERRDTDSQKWQKYAGRDVLPLWVADMDFKSSPAILAALHERIEHGVFGYARPVKSTTDAIVNGFQRLYGWTIDPTWIVWLPGLVCGLNVGAHAMAEAGDEILCMTPVYPPFMSSPKLQGRVSKAVPLALNAAERRWEIDWTAMEAAVSPKTKVLYLCHPHNPVARVWRREELLKLAEFCQRHAITVCSDEIHCDLVLDPELGHIPLLVAAPELAGQCVTLMAPSKTYNVPGLGASIAIIPEAGLRQRFVKAALGIVPETTILGYVAAEAAYRDSEDWRQALLAYLRGNRDFLLETLARDLPAIKVEAPVEATYLCWMNVSGLNLPNPLAHFEAHGVGLSDGAPFGAKPGTYLRINFGCSRSTLAEALRRMKSAVAAI
jgi:cystathionine beta-lyase